MMANPVLFVTAFFGVIALTSAIRGAVLDCPPEKLVPCFGDPCNTTKCERWEKCVSNHCGGCNAECLPDVMSCGLIACQLKECEFGYQLNRKGCHVCACQPDPCLLTLCAHGQHCKNGQCIDACPLKKCRTYCDFGFKKDKKGCQTCECQPDPCTVSNLCAPGQYCQHGECIDAKLFFSECPPEKKVACFADPCFSKKCGAGEICVPNNCGGCNAECVSDGMACPLKKCKACEFGYKNDKNGCHTCECQTDPCTSTVCANGDYCQHGQCIDDSGCPREKFHACFVDPCDYTKCETGLRCDSAYCGGCYARCVIDSPMIDEGVKPHV